MSWNLKGSYVETCSCELMCPCNLSFDHGATYDFCRVTLVFNIREGEVEGTDIGGLKVAAIADTPKVMTDGNWRLGVFIDEQATDEQIEKLVAGLRRPARRPDGARSPRSSARCSASSARAIEVVRRRPAPQRPRRRRDRLRDRGHRPVRRRDRRAGAVRRACSIRSASDLTMAEAKRSRINAFGIEYEGKTGLSTSEFSWAA